MQEKRRRGALFRQCQMHRANGGVKEGPSAEVELSEVTFRCWKWKVRRKHEGVDLCHLAEFTLAQGP